MDAPQDDRIASIAAELARLGRRLDDLGSELRVVRVAPGRGPRTPHGPASRPASGPVPVRTARRRRPAWPASLSGARLLAWTGAGVTLLGVVLLLVLAAARGWFQPPVRIGAGVVLGLGLVAVGVRLHRRPAARSGAQAVAGTGIATLYLVVAAATARYDYLPVSAGLLLALVVAAGGLGLADRWRSVLLGEGATVGAALLVPVVAERTTPLIVALALVLQAAATVVALRRSWPALVGLAAVWPVLYAVAVAVLDRPGDRWATAAVAVVVLVLDLVGARWVRGPGGSPASSSGSASVLLPRGLRIALVVAAPFPALTCAAALGGWTGAPLAALAAVLLLAVAALPDRDDVLRVAALRAGAVALLEGTAIAFDGGAQTAVVLGQGIALLAVAGVLRSRATLTVGGVVSGIGVLMAVAVHLPLSALTSYPAVPFVRDSTAQPQAMLIASTLSALVAAAAAATLIASARVGSLGADARAARLWGPVGAVGLYGAAGLVIAVALLVSPSRAGFVTGQAVVTVSWTVVALVLLAGGIRRPALRVAGFGLVAAAVAKLVLFDLVALDGVARVAAFLGAGLVLLAAGVRYARLVVETEAGSESGTAATADLTLPRP